MNLTPEKANNRVSKDRTEQMGAIVATYETPLLRYAARIVRNEILAQDIVQDTFVKLFKSWKKGTQPTAQIKGWLFRTTHNGAIDHIRCESRLRVLHGKHAEQKAVECTDGHNCPARAEDRSALVLANLGSLTPQEQQVLLLRLDEGMSYKEIGAVTGRSVGNIGCVLHHAVKKLSKAIQRGEQ
jgi:RNA polymerase sigma factor (sigma-70 family)